MENKELSIEELVAYCDAAKRVYEYYDTVSVLYSDGTKNIQAAIDKRNKAYDRYVSFIFKLEKAVSGYFDED